MYSDACCPVSFPALKEWLRLELWGRRGRREGEKGMGIARWGWVRTNCLQDQWTEGNDLSNELFLIVVP